ncbi:MAG: hypothetical protein ACE5F9_15725 [Phycisphaerae bacterium]
MKTPRRLPICETAVILAMCGGATAIAAPWTVPSGSTQSFDYSNGEDVNGRFGDPLIVSGTMVFLTDGSFALSVPGGDSGASSSVSDTVSFDIRVHPGFCLIHVSVMVFGEFAVAGVGSSVDANAELRIVENDGLLREFNYTMITTPVTFPVEVLPGDGNSFADYDGVAQSEIFCLVPNPSDNLHISLTTNLNAIAAAAGWAEIDAPFQAITIDFPIGGGCGNTPTIECPGDLTVECDGAGNIAELDAWLNGVTTSGGVCGNVTVTNDFSSLSEGCGATGSAMVTWTVMDNVNGQTASCSATFTIVDTTPPVVTCLASGRTTTGGLFEGRGPTVSSRTLFLSDDGDDESKDGAEGSLIIEFGAWDVCDTVTVTAVIEITCPDGNLQIPVESGRQIDLECEADECEVEDENGIIEIEGAGAILIVTAIDACGNTATCSRDLCSLLDTSSESDGLIGGGAPGYQALDERGIARRPRAGAWGSDRSSADPAWGSDWVARELSVGSGTLPPCPNRWPI